MILYVISVGLSVTMGLMGFINLAHGVFAMAGGYLFASALGRFGLPFPVALEITPMHLPLPAKIRTELLEPIHLDPDPEKADSAADSARAVASTNSGAPVRVQ